MQRLEQLSDHVILDEAQRVRELFPVLRGLIDRRRGGRGRFVLLGSASPSLVRGISETLAGRTGFVDLAATSTSSSRRSWCAGCLPYFANVGKRLVKSPKLYLRDTGLMHYFLGIHSAEELATHPGHGASFETFVIDQLMSAYARVVPGSQAYFWRTAQGDEVDLLVDLGPRRVPFEIKLHSAPGREDVPGLRRCLRDLDLPAGYVLHPGRERYSLGGGVIALSVESVLSRPRELTRL